MSLLKNVGWAPCPSAFKAEDGRLGRPSYVFQQAVIHRAVDIETFGKPHAVRLRVLRHCKKPVASRHTARPKRLTQDRVRYIHRTVMDERFARLYLARSWVRYFIPHADQSETFDDQRERHPKSLKASDVWSPRCVGECLSSSRERYKRAVCREATGAAAIKNPQPDGLRLAGVETLAAFRLISRHLNFRRARYKSVSEVVRASRLSDSLAHRSG